MAQEHKSAEPAASAPAPGAANATGRGRWFVVNLVLLLLIAPFATYWFQQHVQFYFTEIVLVGGGITLWVFLRGAWAIAEKVGKVDALDLSRRWLASPESTLVLVVVALLLLVLWRTTTSLYFEYSAGGSGDRDFVVRVTRTADGAPYLGDATVGPATRVAGQALPFAGESVPLTCTIIKPLRYEPLDCSVTIGESRRVKVPAGFKPRTYHLLRIVPSPSLYSELPGAADTPEARYSLQVAANGVTTTVTGDLRRQTVYAGGRGADMALVREVEDAESYEWFLGASLRAAGVGPEVATKMAATMALRTQTWDGLDAREGQQLVFAVKRVRKADGREQVTDAIAEPVTYTVTAERVQTIWIPPQ
jgi:hypothetical protein